MDLETKQAVGYAHVSRKGAGHRARSEAAGYRLRYRLSKIVRSLGFQLHIGMDVKAQPASNAVIVQT